MGTKVQLINFILEKFTDAEGNAVSKSKLDGLKKADLEEFIKERGLEDEFSSWLAN